MKMRRFRGKGRPSEDWRADRAVITAVLLAVTLVLVLIGFSGPSIYLRLPGPKGWLYIGAVIFAAAAALLWLFSIDDKRKKGNPSGLSPVDRRPKRIPLQ